MHVGVRAKTDRAALRPRSPVGHQLVAEQQLALWCAQARIAARRALPYSRVVTHERLAGRAAEVLARDQAVRHVLTWKRLIVNLGHRVDEPVTVHVAADRARAVR